MLLIYKFHSRFPALVSKIFPVCLVLALGVFAMARHKSPPSQEAELHVLAGTGTPVICITERDHRKGATLINGGHSFFAKSSLKSLLLKQNNITVDMLFVGGHGPELGSSAAIELANCLRIKKLHYPNFHEATESEIPPAFDSMEDFFNTIGESKMLRPAEDGKSWALRYFDSYRKIRSLWSDEWVFFNSPAEFHLAGGTKVEYLKNVYRSYPLAIKLSFENSSVLILPDIASARKIPRDKLKCDILVLGGPTRTNHRTYVKSLQYVLNDCSPKTLVLCVDNNFFDKNISLAVENASDLCAAKVEKFLRTDETGTVSIEISGNKLSEKIKLHLAR